MKNVLKRISVICLIGVLLVGCSNKENNNNTNGNNNIKVPEVNEVVNYKDEKVVATSLKNTTLNNFTYEGENFTLINKDQNITVTKADIEKMDRYSYSFEVVKGKYNVKLDYKGIFLNDLLDNNKVENYTNVTFKTKNGSTLEVPKDIVSSVILVFQTADGSLKEWGPVKVVVPTYRSEVWLESVTTIEVK